MDVINNIFFDILHIMKIFIICEMFLGLPRKNEKKTVVYFVTIIISVLFYLFINDSTLEVILYLLFIFWVYIFLYKGKILKLLIASLWTNLVIAILDKIIGITVNIIFLILKISSLDLECLFQMLMTLVFLFLTGSLLKKKHKTGIRNIGIGYYFVFTVLSCADFMILIFLNEFAMNRLLMEQRIKFQIVFLIVSIGMLFQMAMVIFLAVSRNVYRENQSLASKYLNDQKKHYEYLETRERETKKFRHDLRHHMYMLNTLNHQEEYEKLDEYIKKMYGEIEAFGSNICVNNGIVDAILNKFADEAEQEGIKLKVEGHFPLKCNIDAYDLCTIFSNLLNNALEAEEKSGGNTIRLSCRFTEDHIIVCIENDTARLENGKDGKFETTKEDKWNHGFGLENVKRSVEKNKGEILIESQDNTFRVTIVLNNDGEM